MYEVWGSVLEAFFLSFGVRFWVFCFENLGFASKIIVFVGTRVFSEQITIILRRSWFFLYYGNIGKHWKHMGNIWQKLAQTDHFELFRAIGSIGNEFAASISSSLSPSRPPRASNISKIGQKNQVTRFFR